jgi:small-conductance mechanosensitive channel
MPETVEEISEKPEVREELARTAGEKPREKVKARARDKFWFVTHALLLIGCAIFYLLISSKLIPLVQAEVDFSRRILPGMAIIVIVLATAKAVRVYAIGRIEDAVTRFTLQRIQHLVVALIIAVIAISVIFVNWYAALTALGIGSIIVGLVVQTPMKVSLPRSTFSSASRIALVIAFASTMLRATVSMLVISTRHFWEFGGQYLSTDHPSGRIIRFPNEKVLDELVYNYSWPLFPYIWNEIKFNIAYCADLEFVAQAMQKIAEEELGEEMMEHVEVFRELLAKTPVDELEVHERPRVIFRVSENIWLEAIVRYIVPPREAGRIKTRLIKKLLAALNAAPEKVMFPAGANR